MSATAYLDSRFDGLSIRCDDLDPVIRIDDEGARTMVTLHLDMSGIERLEIALAEARMNLAAQAARRAA